MKPRCGMRIAPKMPEGFQRCGILAEFFLAFFRALFAQGALRELSGLKLLDEKQAQAHKAHQENSRVYCCASAVALSTMVSGFGWSALK